MILPSPRSAYLHVPFCVHHCGYCNFSVVANRGDLIENFLRSIEIELSWLGEAKEVDTLYIGGGTPTYLSADQLDRLCKLVLQWHPPATGYEWTVEANPGDLDQERVELLAHHGVNRVSLGVQSFRNEKLQILERDHRREHILRAVELARRAGMQVALDLIFAAPEETLSEWLDDLSAVIELRPEHVSTYGLTFEQGTQFWNRWYRGELTQLPEELEREMYLWAIERLGAAGFRHYEISNFSLPGAESRHNQNYWNGGGYFAAGPGAARYVCGVRETNHRSTTTYLKRVLAGESPVAERERLDDEQRARERLIFGMRQLAGVDKRQFQQQTGYTVDDLAREQLHKFSELGLVENEQAFVRLTREGLLVSDSLWPELL